MPPHIHIKVGKPKRERQPDQDKMRTGVSSRVPHSPHTHGPRHDPNFRFSTWAQEREPKDEPHVDNKNLHLGSWLTRASANSGQKIAPGCGIKKSS
jgi:hypothetical protein